MKFVDLHAQYARIQRGMDARFKVLFAHCEFIMGPEVEELENKLAAFAGTKHCISCANGTDALLMALMALGIKAGDEVIVPDFSFFATAEVVSLLGAKPVFVDVDPSTYNLDPQRVAESITPRTRAIIPVGLYGLPPDMEAINQIALPYGIHVIEDGAQSFGGLYQGKKSPSRGVVGCTSFFPAKPLGCYGDGGACFTDDDQLASVMKQIRMHGSEVRYHHVRLGINGRLDTMQAAILLEKLDIYPDEVERRNELAMYYHEALNDLVSIPIIPSGYKSVWAQYTIRSNQRDALAAHLKGQGIPYSIHYPKPMRRQPYYVEQGYERIQNPISDELSATVLSIPMHPYLSDSDRSAVVDSVRSFFA